MATHTVISHAFSNFTFHCACFLGDCHGDFVPGEFGPGANLFLGILLWEHQYFTENIDIYSKAKGMLGLVVGWESIFHGKSEQLGVRWVSNFRVKSEYIYSTTDLRLGLYRCKM